MDETAVARDAGTTDDDAEEVELSLDVFGRAVVPTATRDAEPEDLAVALEALCFALNRPVTTGEAAAILDRTLPAVNAAAASAHFCTASLGVVSSSANIHASSAW